MPRVSWGFLTLVVAGLLSAACNGPISTMRSPYHLRVVEVRNTTDRPQVLTIKPTADQHLGAATTFRGVLKPGEIKTLYLYHGFTYQLRLLDPGDPDRIVATSVYEVKRDLGVTFSGDSLVADPTLAVKLGEPTVQSFSDSLQKLDPFGLHRPSRPIMPDTTRERSNEADPSRANRKGQP